MILFRPNVVGPGVRPIRWPPGRWWGPCERPRPRNLPLPVAIDQEGGLVQRLRAPFTEWPSMRQWPPPVIPGAASPSGRALGEELALVGIGWNFAPVLDVNTNPANPVIGTRAFGFNCPRSSPMRWPSGRACARPACSAVGKHFPGHGTRRSIRTTTCPRWPIRWTACAPSSWPRSPLPSSGAEALMSAHVSVPAVDPGRPGTLPAVMTGWCRGRFGFQGLMVSDDLGMKALADRFPIEQIVVEGLAAGLDHFIIRGPVDRQVGAWEALVRAVEASLAALQVRLEEFDPHRRVQGGDAGECAGAARAAGVRISLAGASGLAGFFAIAPSQGGQGGSSGAASPVTTYYGARRLHAPALPALPRRLGTKPERTGHDGPVVLRFLSPALSGGGSGVKMLNILVADQDLRFSTR